MPGSVPISSPHADNRQGSPRSKMSPLFIYLHCFLFLSMYLYFTLWGCGKRPHSQLATQLSLQGSNQRPYFTGMH